MHGIMVCTGNTYLFKSFSAMMDGYVSGYGYRGSITLSHASMHSCFHFVILFGYPRHDELERTYQCYRAVFNTPKSHLPCLSRLVVGWWQ